MQTLNLAWRSTVVWRKSTLVACKEKRFTLTLFASKVKVYVLVLFSSLIISYINMLFNWLYWSIYTQIIFASSAILCWWKTLSICAEGFCIRADLLHEVRWSEGHPICKISQSIKSMPYPFKRRKINHVKNKLTRIHSPTHTSFSIIIR